MTVNIEIEEIQTTKSEKLLAVVLAVFLFIGGLWAYQRIDDAVRDAVAIPQPTAAEQQAFDRAGAAAQAAFEAERAKQAALEELTLKREAYRTALDAGLPAAGLRRNYEAADARYADAQRLLREAEEEAAALRAEAAPAQSALAQRQQAAFDRQALLTFVFRLALVVAALAAGYALLGRLRLRGSRYLPLALGWVGAAAVLALVMAGDYVTDYVDPLELGPLVLAAAGVVLTVGAFAALQRYLARRLPHRRVRKGECPFCGYPARGEHCEGCGREVLADCARCRAPRRVGTLHCGACGQT